MKYYPPSSLFRRYEILSRIREGDRFLEVGGGNLHLAQDLLRHFGTGTILDFNPGIQQVYARLPACATERLDLVTAEFMTWKPTLDLYDCVIACEVMEHVEDDEGFLDKMCGLLKPGGQLVLSVPSRMKLWSIADEVGGHLRRYEKDWLIAALLERGLKNVDLAAYGFPFVNALRPLRSAFARLKHRQELGLSLTVRSQQSALIPARRMVRLLGLICNPYTCYPLCVAASWFNDYDLSGAYLVVADKER